MGVTRKELNMKKIIIMTLAIILTASFSFAQFPGETFKQVTGKVKTLTKSQIVVVDDKSVETTLTIDPEATYYDAEFYTISLDKIKVGDRVNIRYDNKSGTNVATWFNVLKK
jgi:hypothetical protein